MMQAGFNLRYLVAVLFLAAAALVLALAYRTYRGAAALTVAAPNPRASEAGDAQLKEMEALLREGAKEPRYQVIADRNLFSPERKAWQLPLEAREAASAAPVARGDVVLYGTYLSDARRYAIIGFSLTAGKSKRYVLAEGEAPKDDQGRPLAYQVEAIGPDSIVLKDRSGTAYTVGLYVNKRSSPTQTVNTTPAQAPPPPTPAAQTAAPASTPAAEPTAGNQAAEKAAAETVPGLPSDYKSLPENEKERLVKEGKLRKINTPMGAVYRPATPQ
jgi:hypothetical protein